MSRSPTSYRSVKVPDWVYENALMVNGDLMVNGTGILPRELRAPTSCPRHLGRLVPHRKGLPR